jgi:hypothetical protein
MKRRDLELLSSYLDGQLNSSDSIRLEARLKSDPQLASALNDLRAARTLLRKLPPRRAPRNFTLTRKMVGQNPPLPRAYPFFRFATALATLLFVFSFGLNAAGRYAAQPAYGVGGGGGSAAEAESYAATQAPAAEPPLLSQAATEAPAPTALAPAPGAPLPTQTAPAEVTNQARIQETPAEKSAEDATTGGLQPPPRSALQTPAPLVPFIWQMVLGGITVLSAILMFLIRRFAANRWR